MLRQPSFLPPEIRADAQGEAFLAQQHVAAVIGADRNDRIVLGKMRDATPLRKLQEAFHAGNWYQFLIPAAEALAEWPAIDLSPDEVEAVRHGHRVKAAAGAQPGLVRGVSTQGELVALMDLVTGETGEPEWQPKKVFFS